MPAAEPPVVCWDPANVRRAIKSAAVALLSEEDRPYFLATHAPTRIVDDRARGTLGDDETAGEAVLFDRVVAQASDNVMAVIHGEPGTGKSHLIHWLKLRTDDAVADETLRGVRTVLIQRSTGTLRDALTQMLQQLGGAFERHLEPVRQALEKIGDRTAREKLLLSLSLELGALRQDRGKGPLPAALRGLAEACRSEGFGRWLCRPGGAIDLNIRRLTEPAGPDGLADVAQFTAADLNPPASARDARHLSETVQDLLDELDDETELRAQAAAEMNDALRHAIQEVTGLGGNRLRQVFDDVRRELKAQGQTLALFIEDVSAMGELDAEVINAVEPQPRPELCRLIAVLGLTDAGFNRLRGNIHQRITHVYSVGSSGTGGWRDDAEETARFAARYLNAIRLDPAAVHRLADQRKTSGDITESKCPTCRYVERCHDAFGKVTINGVDVGLFPFTKAAPHRLLNHLATDRPGIQRTPRGLLAHAIVPVLADGGPHVDLGSLPPSTLPVALQSFDHWTVFLQQYCGGAGWTDEQRERLRRLVGLWFDLPSRTQPDAIAATIQPVLEPFRFPRFSKGVVKAAASMTAVVTTRTTVTAKPQPAAASSGKLTAFLDRLNRWKAGEAFQKDAEPRELLARLIRRGVTWNEERVPASVWKTLIGEKYEYVRIEGQVSNPTTSFLLDFPRDESTYQALEAMAHFEYSGDGTWAFQYGPMHQRHAARWLRANTPMIVGRLKAAGTRDPSTPVAAAIGFLTAAAMLRLRGRLPEKRDALVREILAPVWGDADRPTVLSGQLENLLGDMRTRHGLIRDFLFGELSVPQGATGGINYIDPRPILEYADAFAANLKVESLHDEYFTSYWKSRFAAMQKLDAYSDLAEALAAERQALAQVLEGIRHVLEGWGVDAADAAVAVPAYCRGLSEIKGAMRDTKLNARPDGVFDRLWQTRAYTESAETWGRAVNRCRTLVAGTDDGLDVLLFDPSKVRDVKDHLTAADNYLRNLGDNLDEIEHGLFANSGDAAMETELFELLASIGIADGRPLAKEDNADDAGADREGEVNDDAA